jgi:AAA+ ATPase superfamily predicted ATPase
MFVKRTEQLKLLEEQYASLGNNLVILYGRKGMGKTTLLSEFLENKSAAFYYEGTECENKLQQLQMNCRMAEKAENSEFLDYPHLFSDLISRNEEKTLIILDEFHYIIKNSPDFVETFQLLRNSNRPVMFLLCSSSIRWAENEMIGSLGASAAYITAFMKLKEFSFVDFVNRFPKSSVETCIHINAILGGVPEYLDDWQESHSVKDNIKTILLNKNSRLFMAPQQLLKLELREPAVYNTILFALAEGNRKLNDLHAKTGFSRAKISVYLKHLIQLDLVEKLVPLNAEGKENVQKGLYRIKDNFLNFWYRFVFANLSELMLGNVSEVYERKIAPYLRDYIGEYFADVCTEFLKLMNLHKRLPEKFLWWDRWYGKNGTIDILAQSDNQKALVGKCLWEERKAEISDLEKLISLAGEAGISPDYCYLFSKGGFTQEFRGFVAGKSNLMLIGLEDL